MILSLILFISAYVLMLCLSKYRAFVALAFGIAFLCCGLLPLGDALTAIDWNVLMVIIGTMGLVQMFIDSNMPALMAEEVMKRTHSVRWAAVAVSLFAGVVSIFMDNVATVLMIAPVALAMCKKIGCNPVPFVIGVSVAANLQGAATMVGDSTAIMLASYEHMSFLDFFWYQGRPSIFFAVEIGALLAAAVMFFLFRKEKEPVTPMGPPTKVTDYLPTILLCCTILLLIAASLFPDRPAMTNGLICIGMLAVGLILNAVRKKKWFALIQPLKGVDLRTLGVLVGIYLIVGGIESQGLIDRAAEFLAGFGTSGGLFLLYTVLVWGSVVISAFIDNIPYVAAMLPLVTQVAAAMGIDPTPLYFGLLSGATLGGNITPVGASANIAGIGILRREGYQVKTRDFLRIGIPFTLAAVIPAYLYFWFVF